MILGGAYGLWLLNRIIFGNTKNFSVKQYADVTRIEFYYLLPYAFLAVLLGVFPEVVLCFFYIV
jgi:NADH-ubiquinone oxidoreductase chain 4